MSTFKGTTEPKKIYMWVDVQPITTAGIYRNEELGLISLSSNGSTRYTIADKNLGATTVYNSGDTLSESNCGKYYQRGNNYGFPYTGSVTTSSGLVNTNNYGPNNYYSSSYYITATSSPYDWSSPKNNNLWGDTTNTLVARRGPCDEGFHVPTLSELTSLVNIGVALGAWTSSGGASFCSHLKVPYSGARSVAGAAAAQGSYARLSSSSPDSDNVSIYQITSSSITSTIAARALAHPIRPFKNEAVQPREGWTKLN